MKICLCGSTKFKKEWEEANIQLTLGGHIVFSVAMMSHADGVDLDPMDKEVLDLVHLLKVARSDAVVVVTDHTGYYGDSTRRELKWAAMLGKTIYTGPGEVLPVRKLTTLNKGNSYGLTR